MRIDFNKIVTRHIACFGSIIFTYIFILPIHQPFAAAVLQVACAVQYRLPLLPGVNDFKNRLCL